MEVMLLCQSKADSATRIQLSAISGRLALFVKHADSTTRNFQVYRPFRFRMIPSKWDRKKVLQRHGLSFLSLRLQNLLHLMMIRFLEDIRQLLKTNTVKEA